MMSSANQLQPELFPELPSGKDGRDSPRSGKVRISDKALKEAVPDKAAASFKTISEVATILSLPQYVLRFWESKFKQIKPVKLKGGRRYYRPEDIEILLTIKHLLYKEGYTIKGARKAYEDLRRGKTALAGMPAADNAPRKRKSARPAPLLQPNDTSIKSQQMQKDAAKKRDLSAIRDELMALKNQLKGLK